MTNPNDPDQLAHILEQKVSELHTHAEEQHTLSLAKRLGLPYINAHAFPIDGSALTLRPLEEQRAAHAVILRNKSHVLTVVSTSPEAPAFKNFTASLEKDGFTIEPGVVSRSGLKHAYSSYSKFAYLTTQVTGEIAISHDRLAALVEKLNSVPRLAKRISQLTPKDVPELVELVLGGAISLGASDVHFEPGPDESWKVRYRLDGLLHDVAPMAENLAHLLLERVKLLASLRLNVVDAAQDGRFTIHIEDHDIEIRASTLPGPHGEYLVLRLLDPKSLLDVVELGLRDDLYKQMEAELQRPNGMILTTGPTGSGKTTMLYAFLRHVVSSEVKIITIEDPIEYTLSGIEQTQVNESKNYSFEAGLRSIVRQDPDIILVGEIRDGETTSTALQAALTGHLVFSTLHTNDAAGAIPRLIELGSHIETIAPAINIILAQRLVRRICAECAETYSPDKATKELIKEALTSLPEHLAKTIPSPIMLTRALGCPACHELGYKGRFGVFELFRLDDSAEEHITHAMSSAEIRAYAISQGMVTLQQDALLRAFSGETTLDEITRVTGPLRAPHKDSPENDRV